MLPPCSFPWRGCSKWSQQNREIHRDLPHTVPHILMSKVFKSTKPRILEKSLGCWIQIFLKFLIAVPHSLPWQPTSSRGSFSKHPCGIVICTAERPIQVMAESTPGPSSEKWRKMAGSTVTNKKGSEIQQPGHNPTGIFLTKLIYKSPNPLLSASSLQLRVT